MDYSPRLARVFTGSEWLVGLGDVEQMMRNQRALLARRFGGADLKIAIERNGIATDNFARELLRKVDGECGLAGGGWSENHDQEWFGRGGCAFIASRTVNGRPRESSCRSARTPAQG